MEAPKPGTYVDFHGIKVWFVGFMKDRAYGDTETRYVVITSEKQPDAPIVALYEYLKIWTGPRDPLIYLKTIYNELNKAIHTPGLAAMGISELQRIRDIAGEGLDYDSQ